MDSNSQGKKLFLNVQAMRGLAALLVCGYHFRFIYNNKWIELVFGNGWIGVQLFFMISGFIMVHTTQSVSGDYWANSKKFLFNRFIRIIPLYYLSTTFFIADDLNNPGYLENNWLLLVKSYLFIAPFNSQTGPYYGMPALEVGWTLNYEMIFYLLFGFSILFGKYRYALLYFLFACFTIGLPLSNGSPLTAEYNIYRDYGFRFLNVLSNPIWLHFIFGVTAGLILPKIRFNLMLGKIFLLLSFIMFFLYYTGLSGIPFNALNDLVFCGFLIASFLMNDLTLGGYTFPPILTKLGDASYSLYLLHPIAAPYLQMGFSKLGLSSFTTTIWFYFISILLTILISYLVFMLVELRMTRYLRRVFT